LDGELEVVLVEPSSRNNGGTVVGGNARLGEKTSEKVSNHTADAVRCEDLEIAVNDRI
jgi:hypothetical protein